MSVPTMDELAALIGLPVKDTVAQAFVARYRPRRQQPTDRWERTLADAAAGYDVTYKRGRWGQPDRLLWAYLYVEPWRGFSGYRGQLSGGLAPADGPAEVAAKLGPPTRSGVDAAGESPWERRDTDRLCVHISYCRDGSGIRLIWLVSPSVAPRPAEPDTASDRPGD